MWTDGQFFRVWERVEKAPSKNGLYRIYPHIQRVAKLEPVINAKSDALTKNPQGHLIYAPPVHPPPQSFFYWHDGGLPNYALFHVTGPGFRNVFGLEFFGWDRPLIREEEGSDPSSSSSSAIIAYTDCSRGTSVSLAAEGTDRIFILGRNTILMISPDNVICRIYVHSCSRKVWIQTVDLGNDFYTMSHISVVSDPDGSQRRWIVITGIDAKDPSQPRRNIYTTTDPKIMKLPGPPRLLSSTRTHE
jgi:hypothetical protein